MKSSIVMLLLVMLCACAGEMEKSASASADATSSAEQVMPVAGNPQLKPLDADPSAKLIKTADYRFRVKDMTRSLQAIEGLVQKYPAHIVSSHLSSEGRVLESNLTIRVESRYFTALLSDIDKEAAIIHSRIIKTEDVGKQFVDLESRLQTKREVQERFKDILRKKAGTIEELLSAERQIGELQEEIEATVSKLNYLKDQVTSSTINLSFYQELEDAIAHDDQDGLGTRIAEAALNGFNGLLSITIGLINIWPLCLMILGGYFFIRRRVRARAIVD
jgi:hypothetical protein